MPTKKKMRLRTGVTIVGVVTFIGIVLALLNGAFDLWDRFFRQSPQIKPTEQIAIQPNDIVLATFPYFVGNTWEYSYGTRTNASQDHPETNETGKFTAKVVNVETIYQNKARIFYIEVSPPAENYAGWVFNAPCGSKDDTKITYMILTDGKSLYEGCDKLQLNDIASKLLTNKKDPPPGATFILPLQEGAIWSVWGDIPPRNDTAYQWYVEAKLDVVVPAGSFRDCYKIILRTNPDATIHFVCPGVGLVASEYHHFGSVVDYRAELTSYNFVTQPK